MIRSIALTLGLATLLVPNIACADSPAVDQSKGSGTKGPVAQGSATKQTAAKSTEVTFLGNSKMTVPADFEAAEKGSRILQYEFSAKAGKGDAIKKARVTMMPSGGGVQPNIKRWQGQFVGGDEAAKKTEVMEVGKWKIHVVDNNGTFADRMGGGPFAGGKVVKREDWAMTGAILEHPEGRLYFVKMVRPRRSGQSEPPGDD